MREQASALKQVLQRAPSTVLQRAAVNESEPNAAPPIVHEVLRSPGQPLDDNTRGLMESRFGQDFSKVRVHTNAIATKSAQEVHALAYTVGQNIVFGANRFAPHTGEGQKLIAHELTHTIQQGNSRFQSGTLEIDPDSQTENFARTVAETFGNGPVIGLKRIGLTPLQLNRQPEDEQVQQTNVLNANENFRWIGDPSRPILIIRPRWLRSMGVIVNTYRISGRQYPQLVRTLMEQLVPLYPWATMERVEQHINTLTLFLPRKEWHKEEARAPVQRSVFLAIGLPPERPVQVFRSANEIRFYADTVTFYRDAVNDAEALQSAKNTLAEQIVLAMEQEVGSPIRPSQRLLLIEVLARLAPNTIGVWTDRINNRNLLELFGETQWRAYSEQPVEGDNQEGTLIQLERNGASIQLPPGINERDRELVIRLLRDIYPTPSTESQAPTTFAQPIMLTSSDIDALKALERDPDRNQIIAQLTQGHSRRQGDNRQTITDIIETARASLGWQRAENALGIDTEEGERDEQPIVPRPVHGQILNPDRLVPNLEAQFQFQTLDQVDAFRVPHVGIHWYARKVPTPAQPNPPIIEDDVTNYIEVRSHGVLNERIFEVTFTEPGDYEIRAFVNHNFYLPAQFITTVRVVTEAAILGDFRSRSAEGFGRETAQANYRFEAIAEEESAGIRSLAGGLPLPTFGLPLNFSGYEVGTRAEGRLTEDAAGESAISFFNRRDQLVAERSQLDQMIDIYRRSPDRNAQAIVEHIQERRSRVQAAIDQINNLINSEGSPPYPVPVRAFFASRTHGVPSAPLTLVVYFYYDLSPTGDVTGYRGYILDQSEIVESRHYHFEAQAATYEAMMEALFLDLTQSYPNGTISFAFQMYDQQGPTSRFVRFERVTDTLEQDFRDIVFSNAANIAVNIVATLLTIFPPTAPIGLALGIAYNAASLAAEIRQDLRRGTFSAERTSLQLGQIALDTIPLVGRSTRILVLGQRTYRVIEATQLAGSIYLLTEDASLQIQNIRDGQITQLSQLQARIEQISTVNASDPQLDELRRQEVEAINSIRSAAFNVYSDLIATQALTIGSSALLRRAGEAYLTDRDASTQPSVESRRTTPQDADTPSTRQRGEEPGTGSDQPQRRQSPDEETDGSERTRRDANDLPDTRLRERVPGLGGCRIGSLFCPLDFLNSEFPQLFDARRRAEFASYAGEFTELDLNMGRSLRHDQTILTGNDMYAQFLREVPQAQWTEPFRDAVFLGRRPGIDYREIIVDGRRLRWPLDEVGTPWVVHHEPPLGWVNAESNQWWRPMPYRIHLGAHNWWSQLESAVKARIPRDVRERILEEDFDIRDL